jgi:hypothetical protein
MKLNPQHFEELVVYRNPLLIDDHLRVALRDNLEAKGAASDLIDELGHLIYFDRGSTLTDTKLQLN